MVEDGSVEQIATPVVRLWRHLTEDTEEGLLERLGLASQTRRGAKKSAKMDPVRVESEEEGGEEEESESEEDSEDNKVDKKEEDEWTVVGKVPKKGGKQKK